MDKIDIEILEDGTLSVSTDGFKTSNHVSADELVDELISEIGGDVRKSQKKHEFWKKRQVLRGGRIVKVKH